MKPFALLGALFVLLSALSAQADDGFRVLCDTPALRFEMLPNGGATLAVTVTDLLDGELVETFTVDDVTDPWEASWPVFRDRENQVFSFLAFNPGRPVRLTYRGASLEAKADCRWRLPGT